MSLTSYPATTDSFPTYTDDPSSIILAAIINKINDCIVAIENTLDSHDAESVDAHGGLATNYDGDFLSFVKKNYKNVVLTNSYTNGLLIGVTITGDITATISYTYTSGLLNAEIVAITSPYIKTITTTYAYTNGLLTSETRTVS